MFFLYETTNLITGKIYIGVHSGEIVDDYLGSGTYLNASIRKYGRINFNRKILKILDSEQEAYDLEKIIVTVDFIKLETNYNLKPGGKGGWYSAIKYGDENVMRRPDVAKKVSNSLKALTTPELLAKRSVKMKQMRADGTVIKPKGWKHSAEAKAKMSEAKKGTNAWNKGIKTGPESQEIKTKKSESAKIRATKMDMGTLARGKKYCMKTVTCPHCSKVGKGGNMTRFHFDKCKHRTN